MASGKTVTLKINDKAQNYAKIYSSLLSDVFQRKRAYASISALYALIHLIEKTNYDVQKAMTLFRNPVLNEQYEITDLYVNNWHIDVRVVTGGDAFLVPKSHFESNILPDFYAVIRVDSSLANAELIGFANAKTMPYSAFDYNYNSVPNTTLISYEQFLDIIETKKTTSFTQEDHDLFKEHYLELMDNEIDKNTKNLILRHLFECVDCRTEFCCFTGFEMVSCNITKYPELMEDQTLNIVGAQAVDEPQYKDKEETVFFEDVIDEPEVVIPEEVELQPTEESPVFQEEQPTIEEQEQTLEAFLIDDEPTIAPSDSIKEELKKELKEELKNEIKSEIEAEQKGETVSDILDDLFHIEEETIHTKDVQREESVIDSLPAKAIVDEEDIPLLNEDVLDTDTILDLDNSQNAPMYPREIPASERFSEEELDLIEENFLDINRRPDLVFIEEETEEDKKDENKEDSVLDTTDDSETKDGVERVIVDYDDFGEPIYSYITNVSGEDGEGESQEFLHTSDELQAFGEYDESKPITELSSDIASVDENFEIDPDNMLNDDYARHEIPQNQIEDEEEVTYHEKIDYDPLYANEDASDDFDDEEFTDTDDEIVYKEEDSEKTEADDELESTLESTGEEESDDEEYDEEYDDEEYEDDEDYPETKKSGSKKGLVAALFVLIFALAAGGAFFTMKYINTATSDSDASSTTEVPDSLPINDMFEQPVSQEQSELPAVEETQTNNVDANTALTGEIPTAGVIELPPTPVEKVTEPVVEKQASKPKASTAKSIKDVSKVLSNAFSMGQNSVTLRSVNWMCSPALFTENEFKSYLQNLDNILKLNLRKNILNATQTPANNAIAVKMAIDNDGKLLKSLVSTSSGSEEIDNIVLQSINETLEVQNAPILSDSAQKADKYYLQLVIKL